MRARQERFRRGPSFFKELAGGIDLGKAVSIREGKYSPFTIERADKEMLNSKTRSVIFAWSSQNMKSGLLNIGTMRWSQQGVKCQLRWMHASITHQGRPSERLSNEEMASSRREELSDRGRKPARENCRNKFPRKDTTRVWRVFIGRAPWPQSASRNVSNRPRLARLSNSAINESATAVTEAVPEPRVSQRTRSVTIRRTPA